MNREEFATFASIALEEAVQFAEQKSGHKLPRTFSLQWLGRSERVTENIVEHIVERVFVDEGHIYPDVGLGVCDLREDGSLLIIGKVANYPHPRPFGRNSTGGNGPFAPFVGISFLNKLVGLNDSFSPDKPFHFISKSMASCLWCNRPFPSSCSSER